MKIALKLHSENKFEEAEKRYLSILEKEPANSDVLNYLGILKLTLKEVDLAEQYIIQAIEIKQDAYYFENLGQVYIAKNDFVTASKTYVKGLEIEPNNFQLIFGLAFSYKNLNKLKEAIELYKTAITINPDSYQAHFNLAHLYLMQLEYENCIQSFKNALKIKPDDVESQYFLAVAYFRMKNYDDGLKCFENRLCRSTAILTQKVTYKDSTAPLWQGEDISDKTLYTYYEAGFGDVLMFARYLPLAKKRCKNLVFKPQNPLYELFVENPLGVDEVMQFYRHDLKYDVHVPMLSLPYILGLKGDDVFVSRKPYLSANKEKAEVYKKRFFDNDKVKIGIKWQGNTYYEKDRVINVENFYNLFELENTQFYSYQTFEGSEEFDKIRQKYPVIDIGSTVKNFSDTAAAIENTDLIICNDTSLLHLAGAMGKPCLVVLPYDYNWRWHNDLSKCDWYETVKLYRQNSPSDWQSAFDKLYPDVVDFIKNR